MDKRVYPTGEIRNVHNTQHDFRQLTAINKHINSDDEQITIAKGFDNYWLSKQNAVTEAAFIAKAFEPKSGRQLTVYSDQPSLVFYTANYIDGSQIGKGDFIYQKHGAFCFEPLRLATQHSGANINNTLLQPETPFYSKTRWFFTHSD